MKKTKMLVSMAVATMALLGTYTTAFADIGAYTVKDTKTNAIRQYDLKDLSDSLINSILGEGNDLLFKDFEADQGKNGVHAIYDDSKKYVPYEDAKQALEESATSGAEFNLNKYLKEAKAGETPKYVYDRKIKGDKVVNGLSITKEGAEIDLTKETLEDYEDVKVLAGKIMITNGTIKGKLIVDAGKDAEVTVKNIKGEAITGLSGKLKLEGVEAKELVVEKAITLNVDAASKLTKLVITAPKGEEVVLSGNLGTVELNSAVKLVITEGTKVDIKVVNEEAKDTTIVAEKGAEVTTDKPIENVEGEGTVNTNPGTNTGGGGGGGSTEQPQNPTPTWTTLGTKLSEIFTQANALDNLFNKNAGNIKGYFEVPTWSYDSNYKYTNATIKLVNKDKTLGDIAADLKANGALNGEAIISFKNYLSALISSENKENMKTYLDTIFPANASGDFDYDKEAGIVYNLLTLFNMADTKAQVLKAAEAEGDARTYENVPTLDINSMKIKSISIAGTNVYVADSNFVGDVNIDTVKGALGISTLGTAKLSTLIGKEIKVTFVGANNAQEVFTFTFTE